MQPTDSSGVAAFDTIFVGHYSGRASHIHLIAHHGGTVLENGTYGQIFFPEDLKDEVEAIYPYNTNTQDITTNDEDMWAPDQADNSYDPFPEYAYLGNSIEDGLIMWISVGVDLSSNYTVEIAAAYGEDGGIASTGNSLGGSGSVGGNGTAPSGNGTSPGGGSGVMTNMTMSAGGNGNGATGSAPTSILNDTAVATSTALSTSSSTSFLTAGSMTVAASVSSTTSVSSSNMLVHLFSILALIYQLAIC
jgi:hypothetical protein